MTRGRLVVHAHFCQPSRRDPFTGHVPPDASAAPFRDRNARLTDDIAGTQLERRLVADLSTFRSPALGIDGATIYRRALSEVAQPPPRVEV